MEQPNYPELYNQSDKFILKTAEDALNPRIDRVNELMEYARTANINTIGIAHCTTFNREAEQLKALLTAQGFVAETVNCKLGKVPFTDIVEGYKGITCNPAGQAHYLAEKKSQLNIVMGLCVGHDMIFNQHSAAPTTTLIVKDRKLKHNPIEAFRTLTPSAENTQN